MTGIHKEILDYVEDALHQTLIEDVSWLDTSDTPKTGDTKAGWVMVGQSQGDPDIDEARILVTVHENDPGTFHTGSLTSLSNSWYDRVYFTEVGGVVTMRRRFTVKARCLLESTAETVGEARNIAATIRARIERALLGLTFTGVSTDNEYVSMPVLPRGLYGEIYQSGGPEAYDFHIKVRFEVLSTIRSVTL